MGEILILALHFFNPEIQNITEKIVGTKTTKAANLKYYQINAQLIKYAGWNRDKRIFANINTTQFRILARDKCNHDWFEDKRNPD